MLPRKKNWHETSPNLKRQSVYWEKNIKKKNKGCLNKLKKKNKWKIK